MRPHTLLKRKMPIKRSNGPEVHEMPLIYITCGFGLKLLVYAALSY
jgi:hypothetical protein